MKRRTEDGEIVGYVCDFCDEGFGESESLSEGDRCPSCEEGEIKAA
jgi:DNA-directed RNA polymerase subunit RPC12/RpoP